MVKIAQESLGFCKWYLKRVKVKGGYLWDCDPKTLDTVDTILGQVDKCLDCKVKIKVARNTWHITLEVAHAAKKRVELAIEACNKAL